MKKSACLSLLLSAIVLGLFFASCGGGQPAAPPPPAPSFSASPASINFGSQLVSPSGTLTQSVTITNTGSASLVISSVPAITGANAAEFALLNPPAAPITVAAGSSVTLQLSFTPAGTGTRTASLSFADNAAGSPHAVALTGRGTSPTFTTSSPTLQFGAQTVSSHSAAKTLVVSNTGDGDLIISSITMAGANSGDFAVSGSAPLTVHPQDSTQLTVTFTPSASGASSAQLTLTDNASGSPHTVGLSGIGVAQGPAQAADASVVFTPNSFSATTFPTTVTVTIQGTDTAFAAGATEANFGPGAAVSDGTTTGLAGGFGLVHVTGASTATAQVTFDATAAPGPRFAIVSTGGHQSLATFVVPAHGVPVANAGMPQVVGVGKTAHLEGSGSSTQAAVQSSAATVNASGTQNPPLTYQWSLLSAPNGSAATLANPNSVRPSFGVDQAGNYLLQLAVTDISGKSSANWALVSTTLTPPIANAGANQFVAVGATVQLDGSGSSNPSGNSLTYGWQFITRPTGSAATLSSATAVAPTFLADVAGNYLLQLTVNDGHGNTASDSVLISTQETPPIASAGPSNQKVTVGSQAQLDGSASHDPDGDTVTCSWTLVTMPAASTAQVSNAGAISCATKPTFTADQAGTYVAQLTVSDTHGNTAIANAVFITPPNDPAPVAVAGAFQSVDTGSTVHLDGSASHDADGDPLTYTWSLLSRPNASAATLASASTATPSFVADVAGDYVCQLMVSDGTLTSIPSTLRVRAGTPGFNAAPTSITFPIQTINTTSNSRPIVITNTGAGTLQISSIVKGGTNPGDFAFTSAGLPVPVPAGGTTTINVTFTPSAAGCTVSSCARSATLTITHNAGPAATITLNGTGGVPVSQLSAVALNFGNQLVSTTSSPITVTINNTGNGTLHISSVALSGTNKTEFAVAPATVPDVAPGSSTNLTVTFTPAGTGARSALLTITDNTSAGSETVTLSGTGTAPGVPTFNPTAPNFGNQVLGSTSAPLPVTVTNPGTADLTISNVAFSGSNASDFALAPALLPPITVHAGATITFPVTFTPGAAGGRSALLSITDNAAGSPHSANLAGTGVTSTISPTSLTFPGTIVGNSSSPQTVTLTNPSTAHGDLTLNSVSVSGPNSTEFALSLAGSPTLPLVLHTGQSQQINITFTPAASGGAGSRSATLNVTDSTGAYTVSLSGTALGSSISLSPNSLNFGNQLVGTSSAATPVLITNNGTANLHISSFSITGTNAADFSVPATTGIDIAPGLSAPVNVTFKPTATGTRSATLSIADNAAGSPHTVPLAGNGVAPTIGIAPTTLAFGNQTVNIASSAKQITISNTGTATLTISAITRSGANASDFTFSPAAPLSVNAGGQTVLNVTFTPTSAAAESASLDLTDNTPAGTHSVPLSGTGVVPNISLNPANGLNFGNQTLKTPSAPLTLTVTNSGQGTLLISSLTFTGANLADFSFPAGFTPPTQANPITVAAGGNVVLSVIFTPQTDGVLEQATLNITSNAAGSPQPVPLSGTGVTPHMSISPTGTLAFGQQVVQTTSAPLAVTVTNSGAADLTVTGASITGTNASEFAVTTATPITVTKNGGTGVINVTFTPAAAGARTATLTITGNAPESPLALTLSGTGKVNGNISLNPTTVGGNLQTLAIGSVDVAPTSDLTVTITSSDPTKVLLEPVSTDLAGTSAGTASFTGTIKANTNLTPGFWVQALATSGTPQITISAPGYNPAVATVTLTPSGFQLTGPSGTGVNFTTNLGASPQLTVGVVQLDNAGNVLSTGQRLRGGITASVTVNSGTPATGVIAGNPAVMQPATNLSSAVTFQPAAAGTSLLSVTQPAGYLAPATGAQLTATVIVPPITLNPVTVGFKQQTLGSGHLNQAPTSAVTVTITSSDPTKALLSTNPAAVGSASINLQVAAGAVLFPAFYIQAVASSPGAVTLTASAPGYANGTGSVAMAPSAFLFIDSHGNPLPNFSTTTLSGPTVLKLGVYQLDSSLNPLGQGQLVPGDTESVAVVSGTPSTGTIVGSPAVFHGGDISNSNVSFQPQQNCITPCTSVLSVTQPSGFSQPTSGGQVTATVNQPSVTPDMTQTIVGGNLQAAASGELDVPAPSNGLLVTISSDNPSVLLSTSPTAQGTQSIQVTVPAGSGVHSVGFPTYYVQALTDTGTAQLTTSAPGFASHSITVTLAKAGFVIQGDNGIGADVPATLGSNKNLTVQTVILDATGAYTLLAQTSIRGGFSASVTVTSDSPAGVVLNSPVVIGPTALPPSTGSVTVNAAASGTATIKVTTPAGFTTPSSGAQLRVIVQ